MIQKLKHFWDTISLRNWNQNGWSTIANRWTWAGGPSSFSNSPLSLCPRVFQLGVRLSRRAMCQAPCSADWSSLPFRKDIILQCMAVTVNRSYSSSWVMFGRAMPQASLSSRRFWLANVDPMDKAGWRWWNLASHGIPSSSWLTSWLTNGSWIDHKWLMVKLVHGKPHVFDG